MEESRRVEPQKLCPRARFRGKSTHRFLVAKDPDIQEVAHMIVAGVDKKYNLHPLYKELVKELGKKQAQEIIRNAVNIPGACDVIQSHEIFQKKLGLESEGLYGGLSENEKRFIFYEWATIYPTKNPRPIMWVSITAQDARDIVSGRKKFVCFRPCTKRHFEARRRAKEKRKLYSGFLSRLNTKSQ